MSYQHQRVNLPQGAVRLCPSYQENGKCRNLRCEFLHVCRAYLAGHCNGNCHWDHACLAPQNFRIIRHQKLEDIECEENMREILNRALPKICLDYQKRTGCTRGDTCYFLHICSHFTKGSCNSLSCPKSHEYKNGHNLKILQGYGVDLRDGSNCLLNTLIPDKGTRERPGPQCSCRSRSTVLSNDSLAAKEGWSKQPERRKVDNKENWRRGPKTSPGAWQDVKIYSRKPGNLPNGHPSGKGQQMSAKGNRMDNETEQQLKHTALDGSDQFGINSKDGDVFSHDSNDVDENSVDKVITDYLCLRGGWVDLDEMLTDRKFIASLPGHIDLADWLKRHPNLYILNTGPDDVLLEVAPLFHFRICVGYNQPKGCNFKDCRHLHICRDYIAGICPGACKRNHHLQHPFVQSYLTELGLQNLMTKVCFSVIAASLPQICSDYIDGKCEKGDSCQRLHICQRHLLEGKCTKTTCVNHKIDVKCRKILRRYHLYKPNDNVLKYIVLPGYKDSDKPNDLSVDSNMAASEADKHDQVKDLRTYQGARPKKDQTSQDFNVTKNSPRSSRHVGDPGPLGICGNGVQKGSREEQQICEPFLRSACQVSGVRTCHPRHHSLPFLWQYRHDGQWEDFSEELNVEIEKEFCCVDSENWSQSLGISYSMRQNLPFCGETSIFFEKQPMEMQSLSNEDLSDEEITLLARRLSTLSRAAAENFQTAATAWIWYSLESNKWFELTDRRGMLEIEKSYIDGAQSYSTSSGNQEQFSIIFSNSPMTLVRESSKTETYVRRRPALKPRDTKKSK